MVHSEECNYSPHPLPAALTLKRLPSYLHGVDLDYLYTGQPNLVLQISIFKTHYINFKYYAGTISQLKNIYIFVGYLNDILRGLVLS